MFALSPNPFGGRRAEEGGPSDESDPAEKDADDQKDHQEFGEGETSPYANGDACASPFRCLIHYFLCVASRPSSRTFILSSSNLDGERSFTAFATSS